MAPHCKVEGCDQDIRFWCHYFRRAARGFDGIPLVPIPICRFRCPTAGHGTTSYLPPFLHRYLHYVASVVEVVVETMVVAGARLRELVEVDGPSVETVGRWNVELTSIPVRERLKRRLPKSLLPKRQNNLHGQAEPAYTWEIGRALRNFFQFKVPVTNLLQRYRLSLMKRYFTAH